ncbi:hypothetical protein GGD46_003790 [Rhizobium lusitanum]|uniref:Uncharacterized protein n=1 Tax=Rhizobium lusitanum TaxID=293958 RepID=A0A7X0ISR7_9HYPH|nr:hypothetical protein [Rhizobium lusitanum]
MLKSKGGRFGRLLCVYGKILSLQPRYKDIFMSLFVLFFEAEANIKCRDFCSLRGIPHARELSVYE